MNWLTHAQVIFAGTPDQCRQVVETAEPFREALSERGVLLVALPAYGSGAEDAADVPPLKDTDLRCITGAFDSFSADALACMYQGRCCTGRSIVLLHHSSIS